MWKGEDWQNVTHKVIQINPNCRDLPIDYYFCRYRLFSTIGIGHRLLRQIMDVSIHRDVHGQNNRPSIFYQIIAFGTCERPARLAFPMVFFVDKQTGEMEV